jgi:sigma-E factor negative regulatory protein RseA
VVVQTPHGPVLRDPRLEQLLAQHRQYGGMSALQMPAGFLRDATQQADPQR